MSTFLQRTRTIATTLTITTSVAFSGHTQAATLDIADVPLFLQTGVQPNLILALDDSGSMDFEVVLPGNDGSAWFRHGNSDSCGATNDNSFVGCIANGLADVAAAGKINFNNDGANSGVWEKYPYLFPNGTDGTADSFQRRQPPGDHYAIPPLPTLAWTRSPDFNTAYFDPTEIYSPWRSYPLQTFSNASFTAARFDPVYGTATDTINLTRDVAHKTSGSTIKQVPTTDSCADALGTDATDNSFAFQVFTGMVIPAGTCIRIGTSWESVRSTTAFPACQVGVNNGCPTLDGATNQTRTITTDSVLPIRYYPATFWLSSPLDSSYGYTGSTLSGGKTPDSQAMFGYEIKSSNFTDSAKFTAMSQNFANWFTYYRKRHQALRAGLGESFKDIGGLRIDSFKINESAPNVTVADIGSSGVRDALFTKFYQNSTGNGGTPNRPAVANVIRNFRRTDATAPVKFSCQKNFGMLFTDGFANPDNNFDGLGNVDGTLTDPFKDGVSGTMADGVLDAYKNTLRTGTGFAAGRVTTPLGCPDITLDCNKNLHMNFYAVTLGTRGLVFNPDADPAQNPFINTPTWPTVFPARHPSAVDDLWHATINGRGQLLNARRPADISKQLSAVLTDIVKRTGSASSASVNSGSISDATRIFQAKFDSASWSGQLLSFRLDPNKNDGSLDSIPVWDASKQLPLAADRKIITVNSDGTKVAFTWGTLDAVRKSQIDPTYLSDSTGLGTKRVNYLRGDDAFEAGMKNSSGVEIGLFRKRPSKLGDIVSSSPHFVGKPPFFYADTLETGGLTPTSSDATYSKFRIANKNRNAMVYAGANDGMLHAFDADTGVEQLAFLPSPVYTNLRRLSDVTYNDQHKFFVDGATTSGDVFYDSKWHTVLVGGLNKGGQGIYALDITDPGKFANTSNASSIVLWEFTDANHPDLGFTYSQPAIARLQTGVWAAIFGNGYNNTAADSIVSSTGTAWLYIVNIKTGALIGSFPTKKGSATTGSPNGMSTPTVVDINGDNTADFVYAGDLYGNLWKLDISDKDSTKWGFDYGTTAVPAPLFVTQSTGTPTTRQPITGRTEVIRGPRGVGTMVLFGTGKYLETTDKVVVSTNQNVQSYYGIVDRNTHTDTDVVTFSNVNLTQQQITAEPIISVAGTPFTFRTTTNNPVSPLGWYMNLLSPAGFQGERQVSNTTVRAGRVIFTTLIPDTDPCSDGGTSFLMQLEALTGSRQQQTPFDVNRDGVFDGADLVTVNINGTNVTVPVSGLDPNVGITPEPGILLSADGTKEYEYNPGTTALVGVTTANPGPRTSGRQSWRQIR